MPQRRPAGGQAYQNKEATVTQKNAKLSRRNFLLTVGYQNVLPVCAHRVISKTYMHAGDTATTRRIIQLSIYLRAEWHHKQTIFKLVWN